MCAPDTPAAPAVPSPALASAALAASPALALAEWRCRGVVFAGEPDARAASTPRRAARPDAVPHAAADVVAATPAHTPARLPDDGELEGGYGELFRALCAARGLDPQRYRASAMRRRERACLRAVHAGRDARGAWTPAGAGSARTAADELAVERGLGAALIGVTSFFRDPPVWAELARELAAAPRDRTLDVVSLACSEGCELYSAGIVLGELGLLARARLLGLDCRALPLVRARAGAYLPAVLDDVDAARRARWFRAAGTARWQVVDELRARADWQLGDAFAWREVRSADVVACRNLAIYLRPAAAAELWALLGRALRPGGLLLVGKAERPHGVPGLVRVGACLYRKDEARC